MPMWGQPPSAVLRAQPGMLVWRAGTLARVPLGGAALQRCDSDSRIQVGFSR